MKISIQELTSLLSEKAHQFVSKEEAEYFARLQVDTYLKKYPRTNPVKEAVKDLENWQEVGVKEFSKLVDKPSVTLYDCHGLAPAIKVHEIHEELVSKAKKTGIASVGIINSKGFHTLAFWTELLAERGVMSFCAVNGGPAAVVPYGAKGGKSQAVFGTNPISYSIPTTKEPITTDMATSQIPFFDIANAKKGGIDLPANSAVNAEGEPAQTADETILEGEVANLMPMGGGIKGTALLTFFEVLTSSLLRSPNSLEMTQDTFVSEEHGNLLIAFDVESFANKEEFEKSNSALAKKISNLEAKNGVDKVYYPGERSQTKKGKLVDAGEVEVDDELIDRLKNIGKGAE